MNSKKCLVCGDIFVKKDYENPLRFERRKFCSGRCDKQYRKDERKKRDTVSCQTCKQLFIHDGHSENGRGRFCSRKCAAAYLAIIYKGRPAMNKHVVWKIGRDNPLYKERIKRVCKVCQKTFLVMPSDIIPKPNEKQPASFCSRKCFGLGHREKNSPVWKGGKLSTTQYMREKLHKMPEHKEWHATVLKRDRYTCVKCGALKELEVDHIITVASIIKKYRLRTTADARQCKLLWDVSNGQTLCRMCHRKTSTFGRKSNK